MKLQFQKLFRRMTRTSCLLIALSVFGSFSVPNSVYALGIGGTLQQNTYYQAIGSIILFKADQSRGQYTLDPLSYIYFGDDGVFQYKFNTTAGSVEGTQLYDEAAFATGTGDLNLVTPATGTKFGSYTVHGSLAPNGSVPGFADPTLIASSMRNLYRLSSANGSFTLWNRQFTSAGAQLGGTDFWLTTGGDISSEVPEPASMALLASALIGGAVTRKRRKTV